MPEAIQDHPGAQDMVELRWETDEGQLKFVAPEQHVMVIPLEAAVQACRAMGNAVIFKDQFDLLVSHLAEWLRDRRSDIRDAYLTVCDTGLLFVVVRNSREYERDFEDSLTDLDIEIANDSAYDLIRMDVLALPDVSEDSVRSFLASGRTFKYQLDG